jgi:hypothetical protein
MSDVVDEPRSVIGRWRDATKNYEACKALIQDIECKLHDATEQLRVLQTEAMDAHKAMLEYLRNE